MAEQDMGRSDIGIREDSGQSKVFAELASSTDREEDVNFGDGFTDDYNSTLYPTRKDFNSALSYATAVVADVNQYGATLPWDSTISYKAGATVVRWDSSAGKARMFYCLVDNSDTDPLNNTTIWQDFIDFLGITSHNFDLEYKDIENYDGDESALSGGGDHSFTYEIEKFGGTGLVQSNIRSLLIKASVNTKNGDEGKVLVSLPNDTNDTQRIIRINSNNDDAIYMTSTSLFPVASGSGATINITSNSKGSWEILGCMQVVN